VQGVEPGPEVRTEEEEDEWWDEFLNMFLDDDDEIIAAINGTYQLATHIDKHCNRVEYRRPGCNG
jgi:hypothetical protein